jgi:hypothetical protein
MPHWAQAESLESLALTSESPKLPHAFCTGADIFIFPAVLVGILTEEVF